jgi:hypothetical protein
MPAPLAAPLAAPPAHRRTTRACQGRARDACAQRQFLPLAPSLPGLLSSSRPGTPKRRRSGRLLGKLPSLTLGLFGKLARCRCGWRRRRAAVRTRSAASTSTRTPSSPSSSPSSPRTAAPAAAMWPPSVRPIAFLLLHHLCVSSVCVCLCKTQTRCLSWGHLARSWRRRSGGARRH